ncbi:unnamed protein product [Diabrotica balteata]|uniref:Uncharacterized protein n=1 Tax=Diabrotica balteata TaxID=107213 RepID=A0A9N9XBY5_DIABA|nr:unnamed protein product [Diabrotica balteata]
MKSEKFDFDIEEEERRQKEKHYTWVENCKYYILEYCREGSLHGLKYLGQNRTFAEKIWWAISMIISLYICTKLVLNAYSKWQNTPVIVSFATKDTPNWRIPFPAVTICPEIKAVPSKYNYTHFLDLKMKGETLNPIDEQYKDFHRAKLSNWTIENGYSLDDGAITYPRRALYAGAIFSLEGVLTVKDEDLDYSCGSSIQGFKVPFDL